jgi:hypothetical protein
MKLKALLTTIVLGVSSVATAVAAPRKATATVVTDGTWYALSSPMKLSNGRDQLRLATPAAFNKLRVQATTGSTTVFFVNVIYADATNQVITLDTKLSAGNALVEVPVDSSRKITRVNISGSSDRSGSVQLFGM